MIKPKVLFTSSQYQDLESSPSSERDAITTIQGWTKDVIAHSQNKQIPRIWVQGQRAVSSEEYSKLVNILRSSANPCPIALELHSKCVMWVEDERALPDTLDQVKFILQCVDLTHRYRLPL